MPNQELIPPHDLICMDEHAEQCQYRVHLAYARADNLLFGEKIYRTSAKLWLHRKIANIVHLAAKNCYKQYGLHFVLYDGLRPVEAQEAMMRTQRVMNNPHWLQEPRLLSSPGGGGHPRAMAVDIGLETVDGVEVNMGTPFDYLAQNAHPDHNPAHRDYKHPQEILENRAVLNDCMLNAAKKFKTELLPLPEEWWDFRLPVKTTESYAPIQDRDLPTDMRLM